MTTSIRLAQPSDASAIRAIYAPSVQNTVISFELELPTLAEMERRIASTLQRAPWLVYADGGDLWGYAYASRHHERAAYQWSVDAAIYVREDRLRRGVGRALYTSLFALLRLQGFYAVHAGITLPNPGSVGLHQSFGFRPIGVYPAVGHKHGAWHDVGWWQLPLRERAGIAAPPVPLAEARTLPGWEAALGAGALASQSAKGSPHGD